MRPDTILSPSRCYRTMFIPAAGFATVRRSTNRFDENWFHRRNWMFLVFVEKWRKKMDLNWRRLLWFVGDENNDTWIIFWAVRKWEENRFYVGHFLFGRFTRCPSILKIVGWKCVKVWPITWENKCRSDQKAEMYDQNSKCCIIKFLSAFQSSVTLKYQRPVWLLHLSISSEIHVAFRGRV